MNLDELIPDDAFIKLSFSMHRFKNPDADLWDSTITGKSIKNAIRKEITNAIIEHCNDNCHAEYPVPFPWEQE